MDGRRAVGRLDDLLEHGAARVVVRRLEFAAVAGPIEQSISTDPDLCPGNVYVEFLLDALLRADTKTRAEVYALALDHEKPGWMRRDEIRALENSPPEGAA